jgi:hypothetical protein
MKERRLYKRHTAGLPSRQESVTSSGTEKIYHLETKDLSIGGAFIYIKDSSYFPQQTRFIMNITIPKDRIKELTVVKSLLEGTGTVVRLTSEGIAIQCDTKYEIIPYVNDGLCITTVIRFLSPSRMSRMIILS